MNIYVINLDKDVQRLHWVQWQLSAHKLEFLRVAAVNGAQIRAAQDPYCSDARRSHLGVAETGCLMSHIKAWRLIAQADGEHGLVLEDDVHVSNDFGSLIRSMTLDPNEFCIHKLETFRANVTLTRKPTYIARGRRAFKLETHHGGTGAYILGKRTASQFLEYIDLFHEAIDIELFHPNRRTIKDLTIYQWVPAPCVQDFLLGDAKARKSFASNIGRDRADMKFSSPNRSRKWSRLFKSRLRKSYTLLFSLSMFPNGRMRKMIEFA